MYKVVGFSKHNKDEEHEKRFGGFNNKPPGLKYITSEEFAKTKYLVLTQITKMEYRQFYPWFETTDEDGDIVKVSDCSLFYDDTGNAGIVMARTNYPEYKVNWFEFAWEYEHPCKVLSDSWWSMDNFTSRPERGIRDFIRTIKFERDLSKEELADVIYWMLNDKYPGIAGITFTNCGDGVYSCSTTLDSSD
jgi:hypothetical protein